VIRIYSRGELHQYEMRRKFDNDPRFRFLIGDFKDRERIYEAVNGVHLVVHTSAKKRLMTTAYNPINAVRPHILFIELGQ